MHANVWNVFCATLHNIKTAADDLGVDLLRVVQLMRM